MSKKQKAELRRLAELAYERELGQHLTELAAAFGDWKRGNITAGELSDLVHEFHQGPAREVWARHATLKSTDRRVAWGLANGLLEEREVAPDLLALVREGAETFRQLLDL